MAAVLASLLMLAGGGVLAQAPAALDAALRAVLDAHGVTSLDVLPEPDPALYWLGEALFYDKILSGSMDTACASCHHPLLATTDALALGFGTGTTGLGPGRPHIPGRPFIARNAPDLFNRGQPEWRVLFWDGRIVQTATGDLITPAGDALPSDLTGALAAQVLIPVASAAEMRGFPGDVNIHGNDNMVALLDDPTLEPDYRAIWDALMQRLLAIPEY
ncbi:MAG: cytochrome-c peroxidase, partial [Anaerolineae bacterium]|nr:cytochrome-c peroxidase [Anaerolineae bacterium]